VLRLVSFAVLPAREAAVALGFVTAKQFDQWVKPL
jgi:hypothetical protein